MSQTINPAGDPRPLPDQKSVGALEPAADVAAKQDSTHTEADFKSDLATVADHRPK